MSYTSTPKIGLRKTTAGTAGSAVKTDNDANLDILDNAALLVGNNLTIPGNVSAATYTGDGSGLTGIGSGTGGVINTGSTTIGADSDDNGSGEIALQTRGVTRVTVDNAGNLGIGTITPGSKFYVWQTNAGNSHGATIAYSGGISTSWYTDADNISGIGADNNQSFALRTSNINRLVITASGNVGIGVTPTYQLQLSTDSAAKPSTNTWTVASDERLKTNIVLADNDRCYEIVKALPLKRYTWKDEVYTPEQVADRSKLGWIAQDVEQVFAKAVGVNRFAYSQVYETITESVLDDQGNAVFDEQGNPKQTTRQNLVSEDVIEDCRSLNSDQIIAAMYGTIQKLQQKVEALEAAALTP